MCTVSVKVNEALLRGMRPELNSTAAIRQWAQQQSADGTRRPGNDDYRGSPRDDSSCSKP